jgi:hypothetical protein
MLEQRIRDDPSIADDEILLRRVQPFWIVPGNHGRMRIASAAFKHQEMSVVIRTLLLKQGRTDADVIAAHPQDVLCAFTAGLARELGQGVIYDTAPPHDPAHGLVVGKKTQAAANRFAREAAWVIPPEAPST